ncbi:MAG: hypothetical protein LBC61_03575 [Candidatus Peribacteria bacterium]|nr:hypothetical protein [Candidatus Peribacteria bacterium]
MDSTHINISFENPLAPILITPLIDPDKKTPNESFKHILMPLKI